MTKVMIDCGNCTPDFNAIKTMVTQNFNVTVIQTNGLVDTVEVLAKQSVHLITINRKLDADYSDGLAVLAALKQQADYNTIPVMLVTNYEEHQQAAIAAGAVLGFGKLALHDPKTIALLQPYLGE